MFASNIGDIAKIYYGHDNTLYTADRQHVSTNAQIYKTENYDIS